jgi:hypothetical protein
MMLRRLRRQNESKDLVLPRWHIVIRKIVLVATEKTIAFGTNTTEIVGRGRAKNRTGEKTREAKQHTHRSG